uniref:Protein TIC 214 n=1 Tax=Trithuria inconspicua TaxID=405043 RepID=M1X1Z7_9MAGN|nr:Ycf1 [Trithuria inconspicua]YP_007476418.1 Ycf1 [Trithuria inconspicua]CCJ32565.1 Ycf1 [Trithuria inconspicua]CCJ32585.1 Ycf1 [Trithuria inconspicua]
MGRVTMNFMPSNVPGTRLTVVAFGSFYGLMTSVSISPAYLFFIRSILIKKTDKEEVAAVTGFVVGNLIVFMAIYFLPIHVALGRPHVFTLLPLPYLCSHYFFLSAKELVDDTQRDLKCVFLNNMFFKILNPFLLPSSTLARLVHVLLFRFPQHKELFLLSAFVGWFVGYMFFIKGLQFLLPYLWNFYWKRKPATELVFLRRQFSADQVFRAILFVILLIYVGRMPLPLLIPKNQIFSNSGELESPKEKKEKRKTKNLAERAKQKDDSEPEEEKETKNLAEPEEQTDDSEAKRKLKRTTLSFRFRKTPISSDAELQKRERKKGGGGKKEEPPFLCLSFSQRSLIGRRFFDPRRWKRPMRYIANHLFSNPVRNEMSQYFFQISTSAGKARISFTYPPSLSTFWDMLEENHWAHSDHPLVVSDPYKEWVDTNEQHRGDLAYEFVSRKAFLDEGALIFDVLEKSNRLYNQEDSKESKKKEEKKSNEEEQEEESTEYLPKWSDPSLNGPYRVTIHGKEFNSIEKKIDSMNRIPLKKVLLDRDQITHPTDQKKSDEFEVKEINKIVPRWVYKLTTDLIDQDHEELTEEDKEKLRKESFKKGLGLGNEKRDEEEFDLMTMAVYRNELVDRDQIVEERVVSKNDDEEEDEKDESYLEFVDEPDFDRSIIKWSMRSQRRKIVTLKSWQPNVTAPLFYHRHENIMPALSFFFGLFFDWDWSLLFDLSFDTSKIRRLFRNEVQNVLALVLALIKKIQSAYEKIGDEPGVEERNENEEEERRRTIDMWVEIIPSGQEIRTYMLLGQSILRKKIVLPSLIIFKNVLRKLLFQSPEWSQDWRALRKEKHYISTFTGIALSEFTGSIGTELFETELPENWEEDGIQIKIVFPFVLKPWRKSKKRAPHKARMKKDKAGGKKKITYRYLTVSGKETAIPLGSPVKRKHSFLKRILNSFQTKIRRVPTRFFLYLRKCLRMCLRMCLRIQIIREMVRMIIKIQRFFKEKTRRISDPSKNKEDYSNTIIPESTIRIGSMHGEDSSMKQRRIQDLDEKRIKTIDQINSIKERQKRMGTRDIAKRTESKKESLKILKKQESSQLITKWNDFRKSLIERIYMDIFLCIIPISKKNVPLFLDSTKTIINKYSSNNETGMDPISIIKDTLIIGKKNAKIHGDFSSLSQIHVFYKLLQTNWIPKSISEVLFQFQYYKRRLLKANPIITAEWKSWLRTCYPSHLSHLNWSKLAPREWRRWVNQWRRRVRVNQHGPIPNDDSEDSYEKYQGIGSDRQNQFGLLIYNIVSKRYRRYRDDLLAYQYFISNKSLFNQKSNRYESFFNHISEQYAITDKYVKEFHIYESLFNHISESRTLKITLSNYNDPNDRAENLDDRDENLDRKYVEFSHFLTRETKETRTKRDRGTNTKKNTETGPKKKDPFSLYLQMTTQKAEEKAEARFILFDWVGGPPGMVNSRWEWLRYTGFFPELLRLDYDRYMTEPWIIPIKLLLFSLNGNNPSDLSIGANQKESVELYTQKQHEETQKDQVNLSSREEEKVQNSVSDRVRKGNNLELTAMELASQNHEMKRKYKRGLGDFDQLVEQFFISQFGCYRSEFDEHMTNILFLGAIVAKTSGETEGQKTLQIILRKRRIDMWTVWIGLPRSPFPPLVNEDPPEFLIEPRTFAIQWDGIGIMYQTIAMSFAPKVKYLSNLNLGYEEKRQNSDFFLLDTIFAPRHNRKLTGYLGLYIFVVHLVYAARGGF